jgi:signal transduction histidine kinase
MQALAAREGIVIEESLQKNIPISGDAQKLHQLAVNLILNAIQASKEGERIQVQLESANGRACLSLTDHGVGMDEATLSRIFEPFYTTRASGTGLGLAVAKAIVDAHGGEIAVRSQKGRGTTVLVSLPLTRG